MQGRYLTISVDDGHPLDMKAAELLSRYGLAATFYVPVKNPERPIMDKSEIQKIGEAFEIGAHTYNHRVLTGLPQAEVRKELVEGKDWLEQLLGTQVTSFCYPKGKFSRRVLSEVREAGFLGARTCLHNLSNFPSDPFLWGLSTQAYSHARRTHIRHALREQNFRGLVDFYRVHGALVDWVQHFKRSIQHVSRHGGIAHLYFHSWEIDEQNDWGRLEDLFKYLADDCNLERRTNNELFQLWHQRGNNAEANKYS